LSGKFGGFGAEFRAPVETDLEIWRGAGEVFRNELLEVFADNDRRCASVCCGVGWYEPNPAWTRLDTGVVSIEVH
jgi:hypothetical protein